MQKLKLILEELQVESFGTSPALTEDRGTVRAHGLSEPRVCSSDVIVIETRDIMETDLCTLSCQESIDVPCWSMGDLC